jgi:hypothetical protein
MLLHSNNIMQPAIDIFDGTNHSAHYHVLQEAITQLSQFKPGLQRRDFKKGKSLVDFLVSKVHQNSGRVELKELINTAFGYTPFQVPTQKIMLINQQGYHNGIIHRGLTGGFQPDDQGNGPNRQTIALSTVGSTLDEFYAIACHELGHIYGATRFRDHNIEITNNSIHCIEEMCAMHHPAYNRGTSFRRAHKSPMYCNDCQDGLRDF